MLDRRDFLAGVAGMFARASDRRREDARTTILGLLRFPYAPWGGIVTYTEPAAVADDARQAIIDLGDLRSRIDRGVADGRKLETVLHEFADMVEYGSFDADS